MFIDMKLFSALVLSPLVTLAVEESFDKPAEYMYDYPPAWWIVPLAIGTLCALLPIILSAAHIRRNMAAAAKAGWAFRSVRADSCILNDSANDYPHYVFHPDGSIFSGVAEGPCFDVYAWRRPRVYSVHAT